MGKQKEEVREFNFADGVLAQLTDKVILNGTRDSVQLIPLGVTAARLSTLQDKRDDFMELPDDEEMKGLVGEKVETKDASIVACEGYIRNIRRMAGNIFGEKSATFRRFGFEGINELEEVRRIKAFLRVWRQATAYETELAPEGLTAVILLAFKDAIKKFDDDFDAVDAAVEQRDKATQTRIVAGNEIYREVVKIAKTGKDYWFDKDEAYYNDYVIYTSEGVSKFNLEITAGGVLNLKDNVTAGSINGVKVKNTSTSAAVIIYVYLASSSGQGWTGIGYTLNPGDEITIDESQMGAIQPFLNVYNGSGETGTIQVTGL